MYGLFISGHGYDKDEAARVGTTREKVLAQLSELKKRLKGRWVRQGDQWFRRNSETVISLNAIDIDNSQPSLISDNVLYVAAQVFAGEPVAWPGNSGRDEAW